MPQQLAFLQATYPKYVRRNPEKTVLFQAVLSHWQTFRALGNVFFDGSGLPKHVIMEFEKFLECGILARGFLRVACEDCQSEKLLAFSCQKRGFCPSCGGRRMAETAALLVDEVLPHIPYRQWVLSFPFPIRYLLARRTDLLNLCLGIVHRAISTFYKRRAKQAGVCAELKTGAITFIQRFGSSLNLNPHFHILFCEGVYKIEDNKIQFHRSPLPCDQDIAQLVESIATRVLRALKRRGYNFENLSNSQSETTEQLDLYPQLQAASVQGISILDRHGQKAKQLGSLPFLKNTLWSTYGKLCASERGFSLHAQTLVQTKNRNKLEKLIRYLARPAVANARLTRSKDKQHILLQLKKPFRDGTSRIQFTPLELIEKLAALVPPPRSHLVRYFGVLAPNDNHRSEVVLRNKNKKGGKGKNSKDPADTNDQDSEFVKKRRMSWAKLLARVFNIDVQTCNTCGGQTRIIAAITKKSTVEKILTHLGLPSDIPTPAPPRAPPQMDFDELDQNPDFSKDAFDQRTPFDV